MTTIYDLLEINEDASKEEIENAYNKIILEFHIDPKLDNQANMDNEKILNKIKIAYEILMDDEKRSRYDKELAKRRAEDLLKNVKIQENKSENNSENNQKFRASENYKVIKKVDIPDDSIEQEKEHVNNVSKNNTNNIEYERTNNSKVYNDNSSEDKLSKKEIKEIRKNAQNDFNEKLKKAKQIQKERQAQDEYNSAYEKAYNSYLKKMGYGLGRRSKRIFTRIKKTLIIIIAIFLTGFIFWMIPSFRNTMISLYEENDIIHILVNIIASFFKAIFSIFKK